MFESLMKVDLSHSIREGIPVWPGDTEFKHTTSGDSHPVFSYIMSEGTGTHVDAPAHFYKEGRSISDIQLTELIAPTNLIDIATPVKRDPDYTLSVNDILSWEKEHGKIVAGSIVLAFTGWNKYWPDHKQYLNKGEDRKMHFPGFSKESAELLLERGVNGIGIDTLSVDTGKAEDYPVHKLMLAHSKFHVENLTNLEKLPLKGAFLFILPMKIGNGAEAPARVVAMFEGIIKK